MAKLAMPSEDKDWMAESDLRTLVDAEKIKRDKKRFAAAMKKQAEMKQALADIEEDKGDA